jgi:hypothetical protein
MTSASSYSGNTKHCFKFVFYAKVSLGRKQEDRIAKKENMNTPIGRKERKIE